MSFLTFKNKYKITGELVVLNALHIGSGIEEDGKDSPFIKNEKGYYIPGSSFRGYLSTKLERLLNNGFDLCVKGENKKLNDAETKLIFGYTNLDKEKNTDIVERIKEKLEIKNNEQFDSMAGKIHIGDMQIKTKKEAITRDGIKIDRETGATEDGAKFDYDVVPAGSVFGFSLELENIEKYQLELISLALKDIMSEEGDLFGGMQSRGIGKCKVEIQKIAYVDASNKEDLKNYIFNNKLKDYPKDKFVKIENLDLI